MATSSNDDVTVKDDVKLFWPTKSNVVIDLIEDGADGSLHETSTSPQTSRDLNQHWATRWPTSSTSSMARDTVPMNSLTSLSLHGENPFSPREEKSINKGYIIGSVCISLLMAIVWAVYRWTSQPTQNY